MSRGKLEPELEKKKMMCVKTDKGCFVSDCFATSGYDYNYHRTAIKDLIFNGKKATGTYYTNWYYIEEYPTLIQIEKDAKNAVIMTLNEDINISELDLVWFAHELGYKKCTIWGKPMGYKYAEVTYNRDKDEMYVDIYQKIINNKISSDKFNFEA